MVALFVITIIVTAAALVYYGCLLGIKIHKKHKGIDED